VSAPCAVCVSRSQCACALRVVVVCKRM
jgi:hypothetical protein